MNFLPIGYRITDAYINRKHTIAVHLLQCSFFTFFPYILECIKYQQMISRM